MISQYRKICLVFLLPLSFLFFHCYTKLDPRSYPFKVQKITQLAAYSYSVDLEGDGWSEIITANPTRSGKIAPNIIISSSFLGVLEQINFRGELILPLYFLDVNADGKQEILVPIVRNDSLLIRFVSHKGKKLKAIYLTAGKPRIDDGDTLSWDPKISAISLLDVNRDVEKDLVVILCTGLARYPRGIFAYNLQSGELLGKRLMGAAVEKLFIDDFDRDGTEDMIIASGAPNNGAVAGGLNDSTSYLLSFNTAIPFELNWQRETGNRYNGENFIYADMDNDGKKELFGYSVSNSGNPKKTVFRYYNPLNGRINYEMPTGEYFIDALPVDLNHDKNMEIIATDGKSHQLWIYDNKFKLIESKNIGYQIDAIRQIPDINEDGDPEIGILIPNGLLIYSKKIHVECFLPHVNSGLQVVRQGYNQAPLFFAGSPTGNILTRIVINKPFWFFRYGRSVGIILLVCLLFAGLYYFRHAQQENILIGKIQDILLETNDRGILLLGQNGRVMRMNELFLRLYTTCTNGVKKGTPLEQIVSVSQLSTTISSLTALPPRRREMTIDYIVDGYIKPLEIIAEPVRVRHQRKNFWLLSFADCSRDIENQKNKTWAKMARRVAHDIKNPLTSILLSLQRLQLEYYDKGPENAKDYDVYTTRIIERIEALRRMTRNFMKFVNIEKLNLVETNFYEFFEKTVFSIQKGLPPDIVLETDVGQNLPPVRVDPEQIKVVFDNLVANAVNAMPEGGKIVISVHLEKALLLNGAEKPHDYLVIEVKDIGVGIPKQDMDKLFELDFSQSTGGTGLGLAMVKKIVQDHGGHIEVESEVGAGSVFSVYLLI
ncbi:MAG: hypothetical protein GXO75_09320 [Calditrichaeota bacterium]|nr:hypothetical protein [Calditrichota bacterium]